MRSVKSAASLAALVVLVAVRMLSAQGPGPVPDPKSPQYQAKGEQDRTYVFPGSGESIAYHVYVPAKWNAVTKLPLCPAEVARTIRYPGSAIRLYVLRTSSTSS